MKTRLLANLQAAEDALRDNLHFHDMDANARAHMQRALCHLRELHRHDLDAAARAHMERACAHVREAFIATNEIGKSRSVQQLVRDCEASEQPKVRHQTTPEVLPFKVKV